MATSDQLHGQTLMVTDEQLLAFYEMMTRLITWEQKILWMIDEGLSTTGYFHSGRGQEANPVGACAALRDDDYMLYGHRGFGYQIAKGMPMSRMFADFFENVEGTTRGLGAGTPHFAWPEKGVLGSSATLGGGFVIGAGAALSAKYRGTDQVCLYFFGESTSNRGTFHEAANFASVQKLPMIWYCENNGYGVSVPATLSTSVENIADRAAGYGMPGVIVDGQDVVAVYEATAAAVARARRGEGPTLIEAKTYRFRGHYEGDPQPYRSKEEIERWKQRDPLIILTNRIVEGGAATQQHLEKIRDEVRQEVDAAFEEFRDAPKPAPERLFEYIYA